MENGGHFENSFFHIPNSYTNLGQVPFQYFPVKLVVNEFPMVVYFKKTPCILIKKKAVASLRQFAKQLKLKFQQIKNFSSDIYHSREFAFLFKLTSTTFKWWHFSALSYVVDYDCLP